MRSPNYEAGQGARRLCAVCRKPLTINRLVGRTKKFCSDTCRNEGRRNANFRDFATTTPHRSAVARNRQKTLTNSVACKGTLADRGSPVKAGFAVVAIGRGISTPNPIGPADHPRSELVRNALRTEFAARWPRGGLR